MENYSKARTSEQPPVCPFPGLAPDTPEVRVKDGSKIRNLLRYALSRMEARSRAAEETGRPAPEEGGVAVEGQQEAPVQPLCKQIIFTASGKGVSKAITCAEIVKRRVKGLHQLTRLLYSTVVEVWEPLEPAAGLDSLTVNRNLPAIWILLSREPVGLWPARVPGTRAIRRPVGSVCQQGGGGRHPGTETRTQEEEGGGRRRQQWRSRQRKGPRT